MGLKINQTQSPFSNVVTLNVTGSRAEVWRLPPNWAQRYDVSYEFLTDMVVSRSGIEQRRALRTTPRKTIEFQALAHADKLRWFNQVMGAWQKNAFLMAEVTRDIRLKVPVAPGAPYVFVEKVPNWLKVGASIILRHADQFESHIVEDVVGDRVYFTTPIQVGWGGGTKMAPALSGRVSADLRTRRITSDVATLDVVFHATPGFEKFTPPAPTLLWGTDYSEVVLIKPNYAYPINVTHVWDREDVDFDRGLVRHYVPVDFGGRITQLSFSAIGRDGAEDLINVFLRAKGRRGVFYMPTWENDLPPMEPLSAGSYRIVVDDPDTERLMNGLTTHRNVIVLLNDGRFFLNAVNSIIPGPNDTSIVGCEYAWPGYASLDQIDKICWLPLSRFASDKLTVSWLTDQVATITANVTTIEDLRYEF